MYEYSKEYRRFLSWLSSEQIIQVDDISEIQLEDFERLNKDKIVLYKSFLNQSPKRTFEGKAENDISQSPLSERNTHRLKVTVQRSITALRSLFKYLSNEEIEEFDEQLGDYVIRYAKIKSKKCSTWTRTRSILWNLSMLVTAIN